MLFSRKDPPRCKPSILKTGKAVCTIVGMNSDLIERYIKEISRSTKEPVDWYYCAGAALVLTMGDVEKVKQEIDRTKMVVNFNCIVQG